MGASDKKYHSKWWIVAVVALIPAIAFIAFLLPSGQDPAVIQSMTGIVEVDRGNGFAPAVPGMALEEEDTVRTAQGTAIIILYERTIVRLEQDTEVTITELSRGKQAVEQEYGSVWTRVARLSGTADYSIATPTTTATVRGTSFRTRSNGTHYEILTADGEVLLYQRIMSCGIDDPECGVAVGGGEKLLLDPDHPSVYAGMRQNLTAEDRAAIREQLGIELQILRDLRLRNVLKNDMAMAVARTTYGATDEDIAAFLIDIDEGRSDDLEIRERAPGTPDLERFLAYNAAIRETLEAIGSYGATDG